MVLWQSIKMDRATRSDVVQISQMAQEELEKVIL